MAAGYRDIVQPGTDANGYVELPKYRTFTDSSGNITNPLFKASASQMADTSSQWAALQNQRKQQGADQATEDLGRQSMAAANAGALGRGRSAAGINTMKAQMGGGGSIYSQLQKDLADVGYQQGQQSSNIGMFNTSLGNQAKSANVGASLSDLQGENRFTHGIYDELVKQQQGKDLAAAYGGSPGANKNPSPIISQTEGPAKEDPFNPGHDVNGQPLPITSITQPTGQDSGGISGNGGMGKNPKGFTPISSSGNYVYNPNGTTPTDQEIKDKYGNLPGWARLPLNTGTAPTSIPGVNAPTVENPVAGKGPTIGGKKLW